MRLAGTRLLELPAGTTRHSIYYINQVAVMITIKKELTFLYQYLFPFSVAWQNYRRKSTEGVSVIMLYLWYIGNMLYGAYAVADDLYFGLIIQPQIFAVFTLINILQVYWYRYKWGYAKAGLSCLILCVLYAGLHVGIWKADVRAIEHGQDRLIIFLGVLPAAFIAVGFFPEIYVCVKERSVGMSNFFLLLDILGGVFSTISLAFDHTFDYVASITYLVVVFLDVVLVLMKILYYVCGTQGKHSLSKPGSHQDSEDEDM